ncbi:hypothetical protein, partial [Stenotrophomonas maltophilia group sp. RNC7]|uniref:hypothetical protein n=1 Tax=Stenotrophomonas maltophilia group sp. RNC7 TaxID=3071467 RepID=UPI0027E1231C
KISNKDFSTLRYRNNIVNFTENSGNGIKRTYYPIWGGHLDNQIDSNSWNYRGEDAHWLIFESKGSGDVLAIPVP